MKDIELLVALSDDLQSQGFIEPCRFVEIDGVAGGILRSWRFKLRVSLCAVFSIPVNWNDPASLISFSEKAARALCRNHRSRSLLGLMDCSLVLGCNHNLYIRTLELLNSAKNQRMSRKPELILLDREGFSCIPVDNGHKSTRAHHFETIVATASQWCIRHQGKAFLS